MTFLITGASRGIGFELAKQALELGNKVFACVRDSKKSEGLLELKSKSADKLRIIDLDVTSDESVEKALAQVNESIDILINNAGVYLDARTSGLANLSMKTVIDTFQTNTLGPMRVTKALLPQLQKSRSPKVVNITSLMGSIEDNKGGGAYAYRMSKSALNMFTKCFSIENSNFTVFCVHPGWVQTDMGGKGASVPIPESARGILNLALEANSSASGKFFDYKARELPW